MRDYIQALNPGLQMDFYRLLPGSLKQHFPYYALVIKDGDRTLVVAENPKKPNATYIFEELDREIMKWEEMVQFEKQPIKAAGGRQMNHPVEGKGTQEGHYRRVFDELILRMSAK
jgi:hypothetical protein